MICMSTTEPPSAVLVSQRISKASDDRVVCDPSVMTGLLLAVYVDPLAAGQLGDAEVGVGVIVVMSPICVTVTAVLLALVMDAPLRKGR